MSAITVTQINGNSLVITTEDFLYATDNGSGANIIVENIQTNVKSIQVTESLSDLESLDSTLIILTQVSPSQGIILNSLRIKTVEDLTDFSRIGYEGAGPSNKIFDVSETLTEIKDIINASTQTIPSGSFQKIASKSNWDLTQAPGSTANLNYLPGQDGRNIMQFFYIVKKSNNIDVYGGDGSELTIINLGTPFNAFGSVSALVYNTTSLNNGSNPNTRIGITTESFQLEISIPIVGGTYNVDVEIWAIKSE